MIINWIRAIQFTFFPKQTQDLTTSCSCTIFFQSLLFSHDWVTKVYQKKQNYFSFPFMKDRRLHLLFTDLGINDQVPVPNSSFRKILIIWLCHLSKKKPSQTLARWLLLHKLTLTIVVVTLFIKPFSKQVPLQVVDNKCILIFQYYYISLLEENFFQGAKEHHGREGTLTMGEKLQLIAQNSQRPSFEQF